MKNLVFIACLSLFISCDSSSTSRKYTPSERELYRQDAVRAEGDAHYYQEKANRYDQDAESYFQAAAAASTDAERNRNRINGYNAKNKAEDCRLKAQLSKVTTYDNTPTLL